MYCKTWLCLLALLAVVCFLPQVFGKPQDIAGKADQIFDAARQTVTDVIGVAQTVVNGAIDAGKNTVVGNIDTVQNGVKLVVDTGRNVIAFAEDTVLSMLNGTGNNNNRGARRH